MQRALLKMPWVKSRHAIAVRSALKSSLFATTGGKVDLKPARKPLCFSLAGRGWQEPHGGEPAVWDAWAAGQARRTARGRPRPGERAHLEDAQIRGVRE